MTLARTKDKMCAILFKAMYWQLQIEQLIYIILIIFCLLGSKYKKSLQLNQINDVGNTLFIIGTDLLEIYTLFRTNS